MEDISAWIFFIAAGFLSGSIMYSYLIPKIFCGVDVTAVSDDGNPGTCNAVKYAGVGVGVLCLLCDLLKGAVPVYFALGRLPVENMLFALVIMAPVLGHMFSPFMGFKGGKAIATSFGVLLGLWPVSKALLLLAGLFIFFSLIVVINPHGARVTISFAAYTLIGIFVVSVPSVVVGTGIIAVAVIWKHWREGTRLANSEVCLLKHFGN